jgi:hypothetical protein
MTVIITVMTTIITTTSGNITKGIGHSRQARVLQSRTDLLKVLVWRCRAGTFFMAVTLLPARRDQRDARWRVCWIVSRTPVQAGFCGANCCRRYGKLLDIPGTGVKMKGPRSTPGRYFQAAYSRDIPRSSAVRPNRYSKTAISGRGW